MISDRRLLALALVLPALAACEHNYPGPAASNFGDANRVTMAAQVVDPDPQYDTLNPPTSAETCDAAAARALAAAAICSVLALCSWLDAATSSIADA